MNLKKQIGLLLFIALTALIVFMYLSVDTPNKINVKFIEISGNKYLDSEDYAKFAKLENRETYNNLTIGLIKDRFEKHPYVSYADVRYDGSGKVSVVLHEKNFKAIVIDEGNEYLVDDNLKMEPLLSFTKNIDLPVLLGINTKVKGKRNKNLLLGMKLVSAAELANQRMNTDISEIEIRKDNSVLIRFIYNDYYLNLGNEKVIYRLAEFGSIYDKLNSDKNAKNIEYIDMRFNEQICLGFRKEIPSNGEARI